MRKKLKETRIRKNIEVKEIAQKLGISESYYYKIEQGRRNPTINLAKKIVDLLGGTIEEIFFDSELDETSKETKETA